MNYEINSINSDGTVTVTYDIDGVAQTMTAPLDSAQSLQDYLQAYGVAYAQGLQVQNPVAPTIPDDVQALVSQSVAVELPEELQTAVTSMKATLATNTLAGKTSLEG